MAQSTSPPPYAEGPLGLTILKGLIRERTLLAPMEMMQSHLGNIFQITLPGFRPVVGSGPDFNRQIMITDRDQFSWRGERDPVVKLLRHGVLVVNGEEHDHLRAIMEPALRRSPTEAHIPAMIRRTDQVLERWADGSTVNMLDAMRQAALLILMDTLYDADFTLELVTLWQPILKTLKYISPGLWIIWPNMPRPGYQDALQQMDDYLYGLITKRRAEGGPPTDLLGRLVGAPDMTDDLIRDQMLTMMIAGHDTSTALLAWALLMLGQHPQMMTDIQAEVDKVCGQAEPTEEMLNHLPLLDQMIKETLRLYPPIHVGNRFAKEDVCLQGYNVPANTRVMASIYLTHRDPEHWDDPEEFCPHRFDREESQKRSALAYVPFGGGPRNCIGAIFAQIKARVVIARILQQFILELVPGQKIRPYMGATLEPRPGVEMTVRRRVIEGVQ